MRVITVRWMDGDIEEFEAQDKVRLSTALLFFKLNKTGMNRHIPLSNVRWYSIYPETHEDLSLMLIEREPSEKQTKVDQVAPCHKLSEEARREINLMDLENECLIDPMA